VTSAKDLARTAGLYLLTVRSPQSGNRFSVVSRASTWFRSQWTLPSVQSHLRLQDLDGRLGELEAMAEDFMRLRRDHFRHDWRSQSAYRRLQMLAALAVIRDADARRLVETLTAADTPTEQALAALAKRIGELRELTAESRLAREEPLAEGPGADAIPPPTNAAPTQASL